MDIFKGDIGRYQGVNVRLIDNSKQADVKVNTDATINNDNLISVIVTQLFLKNSFETSRVRSFSSKF